MTHEEAIEFGKLWLELQEDSKGSNTYEFFKMAIQALKNQKSVIEELEDIKEEIQGLIDFEESCCGNTTLGYECLGVINKTIKTLEDVYEDYER